MITGLSAHSRVLLATDDTAAARVAETWLARARWSGPVVVDVLCVAGPGFLRLGWEMDDERSAVAEVVERLRRSEVLAAERTANDIALRLQGAGLGTRSMVRRGEVAEEILATAEGDPVDLIAVGPRGRSGLAQLLLGSVSRRVIGDARAPVLVARPPGGSDGPLPASMLLLIDGTLSIDPAVDWILRTGWARDARIMLVGLLGAEPGWEWDDPELVSQVTEALRHDATTALDRIAARLGHVVKELSMTLETGRPHEASLRLAGETGSDLIVVGRAGGRRGRDGLAEKLARDAATSVLVVPRT